MHNFSKYYISFHYNLMKVSEMLTLYMLRIVETMKCKTVLAGTV